MKKTNNNVQQSLENAKDFLKAVAFLLEGKHWQETIVKLKGYSDSIEEIGMKIIGQISRGERDETDKEIGEALIKMSNAINEFLNAESKKYRATEISQALEEHNLKSIEDLLEHPLILKALPLTELAAVEGEDVKPFERLQRIAEEQGWNEEKWDRLYKTAEEPHFLDILSEAIDGQKKYKTLGSYLRELREQKGDSLRSVEQNAGIDHTYLYQLEVGKKDNPSDQILEQLYVYYNANPLILYPLAGRWPKKTPEFVLTESKQREETLGQYLKRKRESRGFSQYDLQAIAGIHQTQLSHIETGSVRPRQRTLYNLARAMSFDIKEAERLFSLAGYPFKPEDLTKGVDRSIIYDRLVRKGKGLTEEMNFGALLKKARKEAGMTQQALANRIGISSAYVTELEKGRRQPSYKTLHKLSTVFPNYEIALYRACERLPSALLNFFEKEF